MRKQKTEKEALLDRWAKKPPLIQWVEDRLENDGKLGINIGVQEGLLLQSLCAQKHVEKVVEIGTQYGCSASWMAMGLGQRGHILTLEKDQNCIDNSRKTFQHPDFLATGCQVELIAGPALDNLARLSDLGPFGLVFIDANKSGYLDYLQWARTNIAPGGLIVMDNVYLFGSMFLDVCPEGTPKKMWQVMREVLSIQFSDQTYATSIAPTPEGLLISVKR